MNSQDTRELDVFRQFSLACDHSVVPESIEKRHPPEPDIICQLKDGNYLAFELVESIDEDIARVIGSEPRLRKAFYDELDSLPSEDRQKFKDLTISIHFLRDLSFVQKRNVIKRLVKRLQSIQPQDIENINFKDDPEFEDELHSISVNKLDFDDEVDRPEVIMPEAVWFGDPTLVCVQKKFNKIYETSYDIELLIYYLLQPEISKDRWLLPVKNFIENNIIKSLFRRVWVYSVYRNEIIYKYPP